MKISPECLIYEEHTLRQYRRKCRPVFPIEPSDFINYIKYRGRSSTFPKYLSNLHRHPLHDQAWLTKINNNKEVQHCMEKCLKQWNVDWRKLKSPLIGATGDMSRLISSNQQPLIEERGVMISSNNNVNTSRPTPHPQNASLIPIVSPFNQEEPVEMAKNPITNYFKKKSTTITITSSSSSPTSSLNKPTHQNSVYPISPPKTSLSVLSSFSDNTQPATPLPRQQLNEHFSDERLSSIDIFGRFTSEEEDYLKPIIMIKKKNRKRKRRPKQPIPEPYIWIETWDLDRMTDNMLNYIDVQHMNQITQPIIKPGEASTTKRVPMILALLDSEEQEEEQHHPNGNLSSSTLQEEEAAFTINFGHDESSMMEYEGQGHQEDEIDSVIHEDDEDGSLMEYENVYQQTRVNQIEEMEERKEEFNDPQSEPHQDNDDDSERNNNNNNNDNINQNWLITFPRREEEASLILLEGNPRQKAQQRVQKDIFETLYDREFDEDVYNEYVKMMEHQEELALKRGTRIVPPDLRVLSHVAIERSFR